MKLNAEDDSYYAIGVLSYAAETVLKDCASAFRVIFVRVAYYIPWIENIIVNQTSQQGNCHP